MTYTIETATQGAIAARREDYLDSLCQPQELHMEWLVQKGVCRRIRAGGEEGYCIDDGAGTLLEFHLPPGLVPRCGPLFGAALQACSAKAALVQSFDALAMKCCLEAGYACTPQGRLFREYLPTPAPCMAGFAKRLATPQDYATLLPHTDGLYEDEAELAKLLREGGTWLYSREGQLWGAGFAHRVRPNRSWTDIGMWVPTSLRRQGMAARIIGDLKAGCLQNGLRPICGCAYENEASARTLQKNGFYSRHTLLRFAVC